METDRNLANVGRKLKVTGQHIHHFISNSPWLGRSLIEAIQDEIRVHPAFLQAILVLDESAGAGRQHNGRLGKIEMSQVGIFLSLVKPAVNTWIDDELYILIHWFEDGYAEKRKGIGIPDERTFQKSPNWAGKGSKRHRHIR